MDKKQIKGIFFAAVAAITYGMNPFFGIPLYQEGMTPLSVLFYRFFLAMLLLGLILPGRRKKLILPRRYLPAVAGAGIMMALTCLFWFFSFRIMDSGIGATLLFVYPAMVALIMRFGFGEKLSKLTVTGMIIAFAGVAILCTPAEGIRINWQGITMIMLSALTYALYIVGVKTTRLRELPPDILTFYAMLFSVVIFLIPLRMGMDLQMLPSWRALGNAIGLALFPSICSFLFAAVAIHCIGATRTAVFGALEPVTAVLLGIFFFNEKINWQVSAGIVMILAAVTLVIIGKNPDSAASTTNTTDNKA